MNSNNQTARYLSSYWQTRLASVGTRQVEGLSLQQEEEREEEEEEVEEEEEEEEECNETVKGCWNTCRSPETSFFWQSIQIHNNDFHASLTSSATSPLSVNAQTKKHNQIDRNYCLLFHIISGIVVNDFILRSKRKF